MITTLFVGFSTPCVTPTVVALTLPQTMPFRVYQLSFRTKLNTNRIYVRYTKCATQRRLWHEIGSVAWAKPRHHDCEPCWKNLETNIATKPVALASEAFHAARAVTAEPSTARGGPWSRPTLSASMLAEARRVSAMTLCSLLQHAQTNPTGLLANNLHDLRFTRSGTSGVASTEARRGFFVSWAGGKSGAQKRKLAIARGDLLPDSQEEKHLHRGVVPAARRRLETSKRKR